MHAAEASAAAYNSQQDYWGGSGSALLSDQHLASSGTFPAMIPNTNAGIFGGDYFNSTNSNCYTFPSIP